MLCSWHTLSLSAQEQTPVFRTSAELVLVDVQLLHNRTRTPPASLQARDLRVFEEGAQQEIRASLIDGFTTDRSRTLRSVEKAAATTWEEIDPCESSAQGAYFNEALYEAAWQLRQASGPANRRVVIWLTDNLPNVPHNNCDVHVFIEQTCVVHLPSDRPHLARSGVLEIQHLNGLSPRRLSHRHASRPLAGVRQDLDPAPLVDVEAALRHGRELRPAIVVHSRPVIPVSTVWRLKLNPTENPAMAIHLDR